MLWPRFGIGIDTGFQNYILAALIGAVFSQGGIWYPSALRALCFGLHGGLRYLGKGMSPSLS